MEGLVPDLAERAAIIRSTPLPYEIIGYYPEIRRLEVAALDGDTATCVCDASARVEYIQDDRRIPHAHREVTKGPIKLVRCGDQWQIADYPLRNLPVRSTFKLYERAPMARGEFMITPLLLQQGQRTSHLGCEVQNRSSSPAQITRVKVRSGRLPGLRWRTGVVRGQSTLKIGASGTIEAAWRGSRTANLPILELEFLINAAATTTRIPIVVSGLGDPQRLPARPATELRH